jgi:Cupin-like domain
MDFDFDFDRKNFSTKNITPINHNYNKHPLMQLSSIEDLAGRLVKTDQCRFALPGTQLDSDFFHQSGSPDGRSIEEVFKGIDEPGSWVALYNVEKDDIYKNFVSDVFSTVRTLVQAEEKNVFLLCSYIFISSAPSVTPFHIDRENNFYLHIRGGKRFTVFDKMDRDVISAPGVEEFIVHSSQEGAQLNESIAGRGRVFDLEEGQGVYFPATSPHMAETTKGVSISVNIVFYTDTTRKHAQVHQFNNQYRRLGVNPTFPGISKWKDCIKAPLGHSLAAFKSRFQGYNPPPGAY